MVSAVGGFSVAAPFAAVAAALTLKNTLETDEDRCVEGRNDSSVPYDSAGASSPNKGLSGECVLVFRISNDTWQESNWKILTGPEQIEKIDEILAEALVDHGSFPKERLNLKIYETWLEFRIAVFNGLLDLLARKSKLKCHIFRSASEGWSGDHIHLLVLVRMPEDTAREEAMRQGYEMPLHPLVAKEMKLAESHGQPAGFSKFDGPLMAHYMHKHRSQLYMKGNLRFMEGDKEIRGDVFGMLDKMRLISHSLAEHVDIDNLIHQDIITAHFPLHDSEELNELTSAWKPDRVQGYFGNAVSLYFAFAGHLLQYLMPLAIFGVASEILQATSLSRLVKLVVLETSGASIVLWGFMYLRAWTRKETYLKLKWMTPSGIGHNRVNPRFQGYWDKDPVTGVPRKTQRGRTKMLRRFVGQTITLAFISMVIACIWFLFQFQTYLYRQEVPQAGIIFSILNATQIKVLELIWSYVARSMVDLENYKTLETRRDALIWKLFSFRAVNSFGASLWIAFGKPRDLCKYGDCNNELKVFLASVFATYSGLTIWTNIIFPWILFRLQVKLDEKYSLSDEEGELAPRRQRSFVERQLSMQCYDDMAQIEDYLVVVIQVGLVLLFFTVLPGMALLAVISIFMQSRSSAWKLCHTYRRPFPEEVGSVGAWNGVVYFLVRMAVIVNAGLVIFTSDLLQGYRHLEKWFILLAVERGAVFIGSGVDYLISDTSHHAKITKKRNAVVLERLHSDQVGCKQCADKTHLPVQSNPEPEYFSPSDYHHCGKVPQYDINDTDPRFLSDQLLVPHLRAPAPVRLSVRSFCAQVRNCCFCAWARNCCRCRNRNCCRCFRRNDRIENLDLNNASAIVPEPRVHMEESHRVSSNVNSSERVAPLDTSFSARASENLKGSQASSVPPKATRYQTSSLQ